MPLDPEDFELFKSIRRQLERIAFAVEQLAANGYSELEQRGRHVCETCGCTLVDRDDAECPACGTGTDKATPNLPRRPSPPAPPATPEPKGGA
jgi:rubrerythrin